MCERLALGRVERHHLQDFGEGVRKIFGEDTWMRLVDNEINGHNKENSWVIPDVRKLIEYAHYCCERDFAPLYIKVNRETAKERLISRDGGYHQDDLDRSIESQMNFVEMLPSEKVGPSGLRKVIKSGVFNEIYIVNNSGNLSETERQLKEWWKVING